MVHLGSTLLNLVVHCKITFVNTYMRCLAGIKRKYGSCVRLSDHFEDDVQGNWSK